MYAFYDAAYINCELHVVCDKTDSEGSKLVVKKYLISTEAWNFVASIDNCYGKTCVFMDKILFIGGWDNGTEKSVECRRMFCVRHQKMRIDAHLRNW